MTENEVDDSYIRVQIRAQIVGSTPIRKGDVEIIIKVPESQIFENPCEKNSKRVIGRTFDIEEPTCKTEKNVLTISVRSNQDVNIVNFASNKFLDLLLKLQKKPSGFSCTRNSTVISTTVFVHHDLYEKASPQLVPYKIKIFYSRKNSMIRK